MKTLLFLVSLVTVSVALAVPLCDDWPVLHVLPVTSRTAPVQSKAKEKLPNNLQNTVML
ncbi:MAG: hypothetical protein ACXVBD_14850 [Pseudobdellovibrio sp.]